MSAPAPAELSIAELNPIRYRGYYYDTETGYYYLQTRYYNPEWRRFLNADALFIAGDDMLMGANMYAYCNGNPVMFSDPSGMGVLRDGIDWLFGKLNVGLDWLMNGSGFRIIALPFLILLLIPVGAISQLFTNVNLQEGIGVFFGFLGNIADILFSKATWEKVGQFFGTIGRSLAGLFSLEGSWIDKMWKKFIGLFRKPKTEVEYPLTDFSILTQMTLTAGGSNATIRPTFTPTNATNIGVDWSSTKPKVATVNKNGVVSSLAAGSTTIIATPKGNPSLAKSCTVTVNPAGSTDVPVESVKVSRAGGEVNWLGNPLVMYVGESKTVTVNVLPNNATNKTYSWSVAKSDAEKQAPESSG